SSESSTPIGDTAVSPQAVRDPGSRSPIPKIDARPPNTALERGKQLGLERRGFHQTVRTFGDRHRPLRVLSQRQAWYSEVARLLRYAAGIGDRHTTIDHETHELHVRERLEQTHTRRFLEPRREPELLEAAPRARMHGKDQRQSFGDGNETLYDQRQL